MSSLATKIVDAYVLASAAWAALKEEIKAFRHPKVRRDLSMPGIRKPMPWIKFRKIDPRGGRPLRSALSYWDRWYRHGLFWGAYSAAQVYRAKTLCGYVYSYEVLCQYQLRRYRGMRDAAAAFIDARMLESEGAKRLLDTLNEKYIRPALEEYVVTYARTPKLHQPHVYRIDGKQGALVPCGLYGVKGDDRPLGRVLSAEPSLYGTTLVLLDIRFLDVSPEVINENYAMIPEHIKRAIEGEMQFRKFEQEVICRQQAEFAELRRRVLTQTVNSGGIHLETTPIDRAMHFKWERTTSGRGVSRLLGFRKGGGFASDPLSEEGNGVCFLDSAEHKGQVIDHGLDPNETYFYTFIRRESFRRLFSPENVIERHAVARLSVRALAVEGKGPRSALDTRSLVVEEKERLKIREGLAALRARSAESHEVLAFRKEAQEKWQKALREGRLGEELYKDLLEDLEDSTAKLLRPEK